MVKEEEDQERKVGKSYTPPPPSLPPSAVIFVSCYVEGLQVGSILLLNEDTYEVAAIAVRPPAGGASPRYCQSR